MSSRRPRWPMALLLPLLLPVPATRDTRDVEAGRNLAPGALRYSVTLVDGGELLAETVHPADESGLRVVRLGVGSTLTAGGSEPATTPERRRFLLGTDRLGRDLAPRWLAAWRRSFVIAVVAVGIALFVGTAIGSIAGWAGGAIDRRLRRLVDFWLAIPKPFLVLAAAATLQPSPLALSLLLAALAWPSAARLMRAEVLSLRRRPFIDAAVAIGAAPFGIVRRHLLPHLLPPLATVAALLFGELLLLEAALSFLGAGLPDSAPGLGTLLQDAATDTTARWWQLVPPGAALTLCSWTAFRMSATANPVVTAHPVGVATLPR